MFTPADRDRLLAELTERAHHDQTITAAALVGSAARGDLDSWSDIDLALRLAPGLEVSVLADRWTATVADSSPIADTLDVWSGRTLYRVFLLQNSLQVDLSFWPAEEFRSSGEPFALLFGETAGAPRDLGSAELRPVIGWAWLYALHARSAIARGRHWQAAQMLEQLRGQLIVLLCDRHHLPFHHGRGVDRLPAQVRADLAETLIGTLSSTALVESFRRLLSQLLDEAERVDPELSRRLQIPLAVLADSAQLEE